MKSRDERMAPDTLRPRLSTELEARLADVDRQSAACYADVEDMVANLEWLADTVTDEGVVVEAISPEDSVAIHVHDIKNIINK